MEAKYVDCDIETFFRCVRRIAKSVY